MKTSARVGLVQRGGVIESAAVSVKKDGEGPSVRTTTMNVV